MRRIVSIFVIICALLVIIMSLSCIGQFAVLAVIVRPCAWSFFLAFGWLSILVLFITIADDVWSAINGKQR